jgi:putative Ca2+/H+ antiporter (TMEM165/GDT1 family)
MKHFFSTMFLVFLAEMADKTQLTILGLSSEGNNLWTVFVAGSLGLILSTALAVFAGDLVNQYLPKEYLNYLVGGLLILIGGWFLVSP